MCIPKILLILLVSNLSLLGMQKEPKNQIEKSNSPLLIIFPNTEIMSEEVSPKPIGYFMNTSGYEKPSAREVNVPDLKTSGRRQYSIAYINEYNEADTKPENKNFIKEYKKFLCNKDKTALPIIISKFVLKYYINIVKPIGEYEREEYFCCNCMRRIFVSEIKLKIIRIENENTTSYLSLLPPELLIYLEKFLDDDEAKIWPHLKSLFGYHEQALKEIEKEKNNKLKI